MQQLRICLLLYETKYIYLAQTNKYNTSYLNSLRELSISIVLENQFYQI